MKDHQPSPQTQPKLKPYLWIVGVLLVLWLGFIWIIQIKAQETNMVLRDMKPVMAWGIAAIVGPLLLIFSAHWWGNAIAGEKAEIAAYQNKIDARAAEQRATQARTYALEIRGVGLGIYQDGQSEIWQFIKKKNNNFVSIYSRDPKDYTDSLDSREISRDIKIQVAFKHSAGESVAYWPIPVVLATC